MATAPQRRADATRTRDAKRRWSRPPPNTKRDSAPRLASARVSPVDCGGAGLRGHNPHCRLCLAEAARRELPGSLFLQTTDGTQNRHRQNLIVFGADKKHRFRVSQNLIVFGRRKTTRNPFIEKTVCFSPKRTVFNTF